MAATGSEEAKRARTAWQKHFNGGNSSTNFVEPETSHRLGIKIPDDQRVYTFCGSDGPEGRKRGMVQGVPRATNKRRSAAAGKMTVLKLCKGKIKRGCNGALARSGSPFSRHELASATGLDLRSAYSNARRTCHIHHLPPFRRDGEVDHVTPSPQHQAK